MLLLSMAFSRKAEKKSCFTVALSVGVKCLPATTTTFLSWPFEDRIKRQKTRVKTAAAQGVYRLPILKYLDSETFILCLINSFKILNPDSKNLLLTTATANYLCPVCPYPPAPLTVSFNSSACCHTTLSWRATTIWAILSPVFISKSWSE